MKATAFENADNTNIHLVLERASWLLVKLLFTAHA